MKEHKKEQSEPIDQQLNDITSQIGQIDVQVQDRTKIYNKCLMAFKAHLENEVKQFEDTYTLAESKNKLIENTYELIYENINHHSDQMLRNIRCTQQAKKKFWTQQIKEYVSSPDLQFKKELYNLKRDAEDRYLDAIEERKALKSTPFTKLTSQKDRNMTLINYQNSNRRLEINTHLGTFLQSGASWKANAFDNKQNSMSQPLNFQEGDYIRQKSRLAQAPEDNILRNFMRG